MDPKEKNQEETTVADNSHVSETKEGPAGEDTRSEDAKGDAEEAGQKEA